MSQCCVNLCYTMKWLSFTHIQSFFIYSFPYGLYRQIGYSSLCYTVGPCCLSILNVIVCIYQPQIPSPYLSFTPSPLATISLVSMFVSLFLFCRYIDSLCHILDSTYKWYHIVFSFPFWLTSLSMIIYSCIHIATNGIIFFFVVE